MPIYTEVGRDDREAFIALEADAFSPRKTSLSKAIMLFPGINGGVTTKGLEGAIEVNRFSFKAFKPVSSENGCTQNRVLGLAGTTDFKLVLNLDQSSVLLWDAMLHGRVAEEVVILFAFKETFKEEVQYYKNKTMEESAKKNKQNFDLNVLQWYRRFVLTNVAISACNLRQSRQIASDKRNVIWTMAPVIDLHLSAEGFIFEHQVYDAGGKPIKKIPMTYDNHILTQADVQKRILSERDKIF